jgi:hypothetical protein
MNRRNFIADLLATSAGFAILPGAGRLWRATMPIVYVQEKVEVAGCVWMPSGNTTPIDAIHGRAITASEPFKELKWECMVYSRDKYRRCVQESADIEFGPSIVRFVKDLPPELARRREQAIQAAYDNMKPLFL